MRTPGEPGCPSRRGSAVAVDGGDVQERRSDLLPGGRSELEPAGDAEALSHVHERVQALITAARTLSDTCADLADALRPLPGHDDPVGPDFGRLRAERTAALLDEAASAARGTLGLLHSAYSALERQLGRPPASAARSGGVSTWPDAFVELPPRSFTVEDEAGTVPPARRAESAPVTLPTSGNAVGSGTPVGTGGGRDEKVGPGPGPGPAEADPLGGLDHGPAQLGGDPDGVPDDQIDRST